MTENIPELVLSNALRNALNGRPIRAAVLLTYQFDPAFFETEVLPVLFDQSYSHVSKIRLAQLEELIRDSDLDLAVYYDRRALVTKSGSAHLDYRRIGVARSHGCFHAKNILLLVRNPDDAGLVNESLVVVTTSANLTDSGWWENIEIAQIDEFHTGEPCVYYQDLLTLIRSVKKEDRATESHTALDKIRTFVCSQLNPDRSQVRRKRHLNPQLYAGTKSVTTFLKKYIAKSDLNLEIISPYFDEATASVLTQLQKELQPKQIRVYLPRIDGVAQCPADRFKQIDELDKPNIKWASWASQPDKKSRRFVHAKIYRFWNQEHEIFFVGSVNLTGAAHNRTNFETGILIEPAREQKGGLTWWLTPLERDRMEFTSEELAEPGGEGAADAVALRFNWRTGRLYYYWESSDRQLSRASAHMAGTPVFMLETIRRDRWVPLPSEAANAVRAKLTSTAFVEFRVDDHEPFRVLVREEAMAKKPSLLQALSAEEILEYWSLLSPEQREDFLALHFSELSAGTELVTEWLPSGKANQSMFDGFAGIFHAFSRLQTHVQKALEETREKEAVYRLFGKKYDSLPSLIERVTQTENADLVNRYVTLLCARQMLANIQKQKANEEFCVNHRKDFREVESQLEAVNALRAQFTFDSPEARQTFFSWFENKFLAEIPAKSVEVPA